MEAELDALEKMLLTQSREVQRVLEEAEQRTNDCVRKYKDDMQRISDDSGTLAGGNYDSSSRRSDDDRISYSSRDGSLSPRDSRDGSSRDSLRDWGRGRDRQDRQDRDSARFDDEKRDEFK